MKVIQVGIGGMGNAWLRAVQQSADVDYVALVEVDDAIAEAQKIRWALGETPVYKTLGEALKATEAGGVINVTPPRFHEEVSVTALEAGVPVLSEKPLADTLASAQRIVDKSNETGVLHMVAQNYRYRAPIQTLKKALADEALGEIGSATIQFYRGPHFGGFREEMPYPLIIDMSIHHFDLMRFLLESDPIAVFGKSWNPPWSWYSGDASAAVTLTFENELVVSYDGSWCSRGNEMSWNANWRIECADGMVTMIDDVVSKKLAGEEAVVVPQVDLALTEQSYLLNEFYEAAENGASVGTPCQDNIRSLGIVFDVVQSFESGVVVGSAS